MPKDIQVIVIVGKELLTLKNYLFSGLTAPLSGYMRIWIKLKFTVTTPPEYFFELQ